MLRCRRGGRGSPLGAHPWRSPGPAPADGAPVECGRPASSGSLRPAGFMGLEGAKTTPTCGGEVVEVCRLARAMQLPVAEMQQLYAHFRDHARPRAPGAELLRDGRLGQEQFARFVRKHLISAEQQESGPGGGGRPAGPSKAQDGETLADRAAESAGSSIARVFAAVDVNRDRALSFHEFAEAVRILSFDGEFNVAPEERELRRLAKKYSLTPAELDRYKQMFDELDEDKSGRIENREFENLLYRCGNVPRDIGISASRRHSLWLQADPNLDGSIDFEEFLIFNLNHFAHRRRGSFDAAPKQLGSKSP